MMLTVVLAAVIVVLLVLLLFVFRRGHMFYILWEHERAGNMIMRERLTALELERQGFGGQDGRSSDGEVAGDSLGRNRIMRGRVGGRGSSAPESE
jgi:hypothetical protein